MQNNKNPEIAHWKRAKIAGTCMFLNADELEIVLMVAQGLKDGKEVYGDLDIETDTRDMRAEAAQELRDCLVYTSAAILRLL